MWCDVYGVGWAWAGLIMGMGWSGHALCSAKLSLAWAAPSMGWAYHGMGWAWAGLGMAWAAHELFWPWVVLCMVCAGHGLG